MLFFKKIFFGFSLCILSGFSLHAQHEMTMPSLNWVTQASYTDLTILHKQYKTSLSIPVIGSTQFYYFNSAFSFNSLVKNNVIDPNRTITKLKKNNQLYTGGSIDLFSLRFYKKKSIIQISLRDVWTQRLVYTKDLANLLWNGNGSFAGHTANLNNVRVAANYYRELGIAVTKPINEKFTVGVRAKLLMGIGNVTTQKSKNSLYTDQNGLLINGNSQFNLRTSGLVNAEDVTALDLLGLHNLGAALDLGARYKLSEKISIACNVTNLGFIHWKQHVKNYHVDGDYNYTGYVIKDSIDIVNADWGNIVDTLEVIFKPKQDSKPYNAWLTPSVYISSNYKLSETATIYGALALDFYHSVRGAITVGATKSIGKTLQATINYTVTPSSYFNIGGGFVVRGGPVQMYIVSDNVVALFNPYSIKYVNCRLGINLLFGKVE